MTNEEASNILRLVATEALEGVSRFVESENNRDMFKQAYEMAIKSLEAESNEAAEAEPTLYGYDIKFLSSIAAVMAKNRISTVEAVKIFSDFKRTVDFVLEEQQKEIDKFLKVHFLKGEENGTDQ